MHEAHETVPTFVEAARAVWQTPVLPALAASTAELHIGGASPDAEGAS
jgi:hypothetical protein